MSAMLQTKTCWAAATRQSFIYKDNVRTFMSARTSNTTEPSWFFIDNVPRISDHLPQESITFIITDWVFLWHLSKSFQTDFCLHVGRQTTALPQSFNRVWVHQELSKLRFTIFTSKVQCSKLMHSYSYSYLLKIQLGICRKLREGLPLRAKNLQDN